MGYLRNIIADARPRQAAIVEKTTASTLAIPSVDGSFSTMDHELMDTPVSAAMSPELNTNADSTVNKTLEERSFLASSVTDNTQEVSEKNQVFGGEEGTGASDRRRAVPPFEDHSETKQYVYSQSSRTASNEKEETETSANRPGGSRTHVTEIGDEAISSVVSHFSESTSNFLESVMTRQEISNATEESETRTSSSNDRGENGVFLRKQSGNKPSGGFSASPPLFFSSEKDAASTVSFVESHSRDVAGPGEKEEGVGNPAQSVKHLDVTKQQTDRSVNYLHKGNDRAEPVAHQEEDKEREDSPVSPVSSEVRREKRKEEPPGLKKLRKQDQGEKRFVEQMDKERTVQQGIVLNKDIPEQLRVMAQDKVTGESPVFTVKQKKIRPEGPKVTIGSIEVIIEAPAVPSNTVEQQASSPSLSSRHYLRRL